MAIVKERNLFTITHEKMSTPVVFDVNTGVISRKGKTCTTTPAYSKQAVFDYVRTEQNVPYTMELLYQLACQNNVPMFRLGAYADRFRLADRFDAIGYPVSDDYDVCTLISRGSTKELEENFKAFAKYFKFHPEVRYEDWKSLTRLQALRESYKFPSEYHVSPAIEHFIEAYGDRYDKKYRSHIVYWLIRGVFNFYYDGTPTGRFSSSRWVDNMAEAFSNLLRMCAEMNIEPQKEEFFRQYGTVQQNYRVFKETANADKMAEYQNNVPLMFEDDNLTVIVPTTPTEFADEAQYQQNCVYSYYMSQVVRHQTHVVFIRKKGALNIPYITCEVNNRGHIVQYLTRYNREVGDSIGKNFYEEYRAYLLENWK